jgi:hypothetical protein
MDRQSGVVRRLVPVSIAAALATLAVLLGAAAPASAAAWTCGFNVSGTATKTGKGPFSTTGPATCTIDGASPEVGTLGYAGTYDGNSFLSCDGPTLDGTATLQLPSRQLSFTLHVTTFGGQAHLYVPLDWAGTSGLGRGVIAVPPGCNDPTPVTLAASLWLNTL